MDERRQGGHWIKDDSRQIGEHNRVGGEQRNDTWTEEHMERRNNTQQSKICIAFSGRDFNLSSVTTMCLPSDVLNMLEGDQHFEIR